MLLSNKIKNGKIYSFEPNTSNLEYLKNNIKINNINNIIVNKSAISDFNGQAILNNNPLNDGGNSLNNFKYDVINKEFVNCITIDNFIKDNLINKLNLIKVDVEGLQFNVLKGASETLKLFKPKIIVEAFSEDEKNEVINYLKKIGYEHFIRADEYDLYIY